MVIGCAVLIGIGIFFAATDDDYSSPEPVSSYSTDPTTTVADLAVGECFDDGNAEGVVRQPCTVAHDGEIIGVVTLPEGPYPGDNGVDKAADRACTHDFTKYVGKSLDDSELDLYYWTPTEDLWNDDDRLVVCDAPTGLRLRQTDRHHQEQPPVELLEYSPRVPPASRLSPFRLSPDLAGCRPRFALPRDRSLVAPAGELVLRPERPSLSAQRCRRAE